MSHLPVPLIRDARDLYFLSPHDGYFRSAPSTGPATAAGASCGSAAAATEEEDPLTAAAAADALASLQRASGGRNLSVPGVAAAARNGDDDEEEEEVRLLPTAGAGRGLQRLRIITQPPVEGIWNCCSA